MPVRFARWPQSLPLAVCLIAFLSPDRPCGALEPRETSTLYALNPGARPTASFLESLFDSGRRRPPTPAYLDAAFPPAAQAQRLSAPSAAQVPIHFRMPVPPPPPAYTRTFRQLLKHPERTDRFDALILRYSDSRGLDPRLVKAIVAAESEFHLRARSPAGALGLMQLLPATAGEMGVHRARLFDPASNIRAGAAYLTHLFMRALKIYRLREIRFRDAPRWLVEKVLAAYNAGPRFLTRGSWYRQTRLYVRKVLLYYQSRVTEFRTPAVSDFSQG